MILDPVTETPVRSFAQIRSDAEAFERLLASRSLRVPSGSALEAGLHAASTLADIAVAGARPPKDIVIALGAAYLSRALTEAAAGNRLAGLASLVPNLVALGSDPIPTSEGAASTQPRNAVFELEVGACFAAAGVTAEAGEPDIVLTHDGRWNIAVKNLYSTAKLVDNIQVGIRQALEQPGEYGMVFVGVSNSFAPGRFLPLISPKDDTWGSFPNAQSAINAVRDAVVPLETTVKQEAPLQLLKGEASTRFRGVVFIAHSVCGIGGNAGILTHVSMLDRNDLFGHSIYGPEAELAKRFWRQTQALMSS